MVIILVQPEMEINSSPCHFHHKLPLQGNAKGKCSKQIELEINQENYVFSQAVSKKHLK